MRGRSLLWISLGLNVAIVAAWFYFPRAVTNKNETPAAGTLAADPGKIYKTNVVVRRQNFIWNQIESADYATYIANLRAIGCPEATIRDIIVADVNQLFARRRATEVVTAEQQWWRSEPDADVTEAASEKLKALEDERRALLVTLLGPAWESGYYPYPAYPNSPPLDGPVLGALPADVKRAIHDVESRASERRQAYLTATQKEGKQPDPVELARMRQQTRSELAQVLNAEQLDEYLLRYSTDATSLRTELHGINLTPDQFRALFRQTDALDQQIQLLTADDPASAARRQELERQRDQSLQQSLGQDDYKKYKLLQDPVYRDTQSGAQQSGVASDKIVPLYEINRATEQERQRISNDAALTAEQRDQALEAVQSAQQNSWRKLLGDETYQRYLQANTKP
jgi:hypothetical protein